MSKQFANMTSAHSRKYRMIFLEQALVSIAIFERVHPRNFTLVFHDSKKTSRMSNATLTRSIKTGVLLIPSHFLRSFKKLEYLRL